MNFYCFSVVLQMVATILEHTNGKLCPTTLNRCENSASLLHRDTGFFRTLLDPPAGFTDVCPVAVSARDLINAFGGFVGELLLWWTRVYHRHACTNSYALAQTYTMQQKPILMDESTSIHYNISQFDLCYYFPFLLLRRIHTHRYITNRKMFWYINKIIQIIS